MRRGTRQRCTQGRLAWTLLESEDRGLMGTQPAKPFVSEVAMWKRRKCVRQARAGAMLVPILVLVLQPIFVVPEGVAQTRRAAPSSQGGVAAIVARTTPSVAVIEADRTWHGTALGSGFMVDSLGLVATNAHVVEGAIRVRVRFQDDPDHAHSAGIVT